MTARAVGRRRAAAIAVSAAGHVLIVLALVFASINPSVPAPLAPLTPMTVALVVPPAPAVDKVAPVMRPAAARASAPPRTFRLTPPPPADIAPLPASAAAPAHGVEGVSDGELAGAATADSGTPGGECDMVRQLQGALRKDALVQASASSVGQGGGARKAILVWKGDWVTSGGQDGKGLAAVREAILWEVGFAPEVCRRAAVHGLVLISLSDTPGAPRLVLGGGDWRWSDLLTPRGLGGGAAGAR